MDRGSPQTTPTSTTTTTTTTTTSPVVMYSTNWCGYCHRLKSQMNREGIEFEVVDIEHHPDAAAIVAEHNAGSFTVPTLVFSDRSAQTNPSIKDVKAKLAALAS